MAADEFRLSDDAENDLAIGEGDLADRETFGLLHKDGGEPGGGNLPYLHRNADGLGVGGIHPQHRREQGAVAASRRKKAPASRRFFSSGRPRMRVPLTASLTESMVFSFAFYI